MVVVLFLALTTFAVARPATSTLMLPATFAQRRNLWTTITLLAFLSHNFWIYALCSALVLLYARQKEPNPCALFWLLMFLAPPISAQIPGFGLINSLFEINHPRLLSIFVLLPATLALSNRSTSAKLGKIWPDRLLLSYLIFSAALLTRDTNFTNLLRETLYLLTDIFLPYYAFSRGITQLKYIKDAMAAFVLGTAVLAGIGVFEVARHWLLYSALPDAWGLDSSGSYLGREGLLRASASTGQAIVLGYLLAVGLGFFLYLSTALPRAMHRRLGFLALLAGLVAPLSRGPWVGAASAALAFLLTGPRSGRKLLMSGIAVTAAVGLLAVLPFGQKILGLLPFIGTAETGNVTYRQRLFDNSLLLINENFWLGSSDYRERLAAMGMVQGQGIVDIVNTYVRVALEHGTLGLSMFVGFFLSVLWGLRRAMSDWKRHCSTQDDETLRMGRALLATLTGIMVIIATVSSISHIPWVYWSVAGAAVGYITMVRRQLQLPREERS